MNWKQNVRRYMFLQHLRIFSRYGEGFYFLYNEEGELLTLMKIQEKWDDVTLRKNES
jgi:hypothetical protein